MQIVLNIIPSFWSHICMNRQKIASFKLPHDNMINLDYFVSSTNSIQLDCTKGKSSYNSICVLFDFSSMSHPSSFDVGNSFQHINLHSTAYLPLSHKLFLDTMQSVMSRIHKINIVLLDTKIETTIFAINLLYECVLQIFSQRRSRLSSLCPLERKRKLRELLFPCKFITTLIYKLDILLFAYILCS